jgi:DNA primase
MIPDALLDEVRARADIVEIVGEQISLRRAGKDFKALCPFHNEKNPSFYVVPAKGIYKCFSCGESGDVFTFLMKRNGLDFPEAVRQIAARVGVEIPDSAPDRQHDDPDRALYEAVAFADDLFRTNLWERDAGERARRYIEQRGIDRATAERFLLGYAPDGWRALREAAHKHGIEDGVLLAAGLIKESERGEEPYDRFRDRLIFPIADVGGRIVAFGGRLLRAAENAAKYLNSPDGPIFHKGGILYGLNWSKSAIRREGSALVVEGYMDYLAVAAAGVENVVAGMGTALTPEQANLVARYTARAYLLYDSDPAGMKATFRTADALLRAGVHPLVVSLPEGEDPDSLVRRGGVAALAPLLEGAQDVLERKLRMLEERGHFADIEGSRRALDRLLPTLRAVIDPALRDIYLGRVAERTGVRRETLETEMAAEVPLYGSAAAARGARERYRSGRNGSPSAYPPHRPERGRAEPPLQAAGAERMVLLLLVRDPEWIDRAISVLRGADFRNEAHREIFAALAAAERAPDGGLPPIGGLSAEAARRLDELRADRVEVTDAEQSFADAVADIKVRGLFLQLDALDTRMDRAAADEKGSLMRERQEIHRQLRELDAAAELGFKTSRRYRAYGRTPGRKGPPTEAE